MSSAADLPQRLRWTPLESADALADAAARRIREAAARAIAERGRFTIVLAGGDTPRAAYARLRAAAVDWRDWHVYFGDERCTAADDPQRNSRMAEDAWLAHVPIPRAHVHEIPAELGPVEGARRYAASLREVGSFDLVLLGLGEDGHTASLFPDDDAGLGVDAPDAVPVFAAPKPPPERVSLSARRLSRAEIVLFLVAGAGKAAAVQRWRGGEPIPAAFIRPPDGVDVLVAAVSERAAAAAGREPAR